MSGSIALERQPRPAGFGCRHHWIIATPNGATSRGVCKRCGAARDFPNAADDALLATAELPRWHVAGPRTVSFGKSDSAESSDRDIE